MKLIKCGNIIITSNNILDVYIPIILTHGQLSDSKVFRDDKFNIIEWVFTQNNNDKVGDIFRTKKRHSLFDTISCKNIIIRGLVSEAS